MNSTFCKNRSNYTKRNKQSRNPLSAQPYQNRTIPRFAPTPLSFNERSVCFASALSLEKHYTLASLVKGEVLSPERIRATTGGIAIPPSFAPHQPFQIRTIPRLALSPLPFNERSACFASLRNSGRSTSGIHARPRKRVRFCCSVKPSQLWWGLFLVRTINEIFRTITLAFRRAMGLPLPLHLTSPSPQPLQKDNNPSHRTTPLPPLSKVRCCRPKEFGRLPEGLPYHHLSPRTNPSKSALSLAPHQHPCLLMNALPVSQNVANHQHPCLPCQREVD